MGMVTKCRELAKANGWFMARQFENLANADVHERTTAREIMDAFEARSLTICLGLRHRRYLDRRGASTAAERPDTKIITTEPDGAALLSDGREQERREDGSASGSHPAWAPI
ncbi:MAG: hypothetical protein CM15mP74_18980 [Halieaceae bacterium]|nr:MAG: hypothetical protein CM15mP74_18980 [Halieaceae bacterium]